jgi:predicted GIY-YIG superfamily endonuclease
MAVSRALRRLLRIRELEEEQRRLMLESSLGELLRLQGALTATFEREREGRSLVQDSARTNQLPDRLAGLEEARAADRTVFVLEPRIAVKEEEVTAHRQEYLLKRIERRQAETLIQESEAREAIQADRRGQQSLDDWYGARQYRDKADADAPTPTAEDFATPSPVEAELSSEHPSCAGDRS